MFLLKKKEGAYRRRNYFIKKGFQSRFILKFLGIVICGATVSGGFIYLLTSRNIDDTFYSSHIKASSTGELVLPSLIGVNFSVVVLVILAVAVLTLFISNKIAGPVYRMGKSTERIGLQDFTTNFTIRSGDEAKYLADSFEEMNRGVKGRFDRLSLKARDVDAAAASLLYNSSTCSEVRQVDKDMVAELAAGINALKGELSKIKS